MTIDVAVEFGGVSVGDETARVPIKIERSSIDLMEADEHFAGKRLDGLITLRTGPANQKTLPGMEEGFPVIESTFDIKSYGVNSKRIGAALTFNLASIDRAELCRFARRSGRLVAEVIGDAAGHGDDDDYEHPDVAAGKDRPHGMPALEAAAKAAKAAKSKKAPPVVAPPDPAQAGKSGDVGPTGQTTCPLCQHVYEAELTECPDCHGKGLAIDAFGWADASIDQLDIPDPWKVKLRAREILTVGALDNAIEDGELKKWKEFAPANRKTILAAVEACKANGEAEGES